MEKKLKYPNCSPNCSAQKGPSTRERKKNKISKLLLPNLLSKFTLKKTEIFLIDALDMHFCTCLFVSDNVFGTVEAK